MRSFMSPGKRIRSFRLKRGMTQRALGRAVGFPAKTADIRIAQYESGARTPKHDLLCAFAQTLEVPVSALEVPYIKSRDELGNYKGFHRRHWHKTGRAVSGIHRAKGTGAPYCPEQSLFHPAS